jgi:O-antigen ligase
MSNFVILGAGFIVLAAASALHPIRGWAKDLLSQRYLLLFIVPVFVLLGWPIDNLEAYRGGSELGWQRAVRIALFTGVSGLLMVSTMCQRPFRIPRSGVFALFALYTLLAAFSSSYSAEPLQTGWKVFELFVVLFFALVLYARQESRPEKVISLTNGLLYLAFALCLMSVIGGAISPERAWTGFGLAGLGTRSMAGVVPAINANMLGQLGGIVALVGISRLLTTTMPVRLGDWLVPLVGVVTLVLAYSRTSLITFALFFVVLIILLRRVTLMLFMVPALFISIAIFPGIIMEYLARGQDAQQFASMSGRIYMWEAALEAWRQSPLLGHGFFVGHKHVELDNGRFLATVDSTYLETLVNLGIVGFLLILAFGIGTFRLAWRVLAQCRKVSLDMVPTVSTLFIFVAFIVVRSFTASSFQVLHYNLLFLMVALVGLHIVERHAFMNDMDQMRPWARTSIIPVR